MEIHPDAPANPLYDDLNGMLDIERSTPYDYKHHGILRTIQISEHNEALIKKVLIDTQNTCLPTLNRLQNSRNVSQLQQRVYHTLVKHIDPLNICIIRSRTNTDANHCFSKFSNAIETKFKPDLKKILLEY